MCSHSDRSALKKKLKEIKKLEVKEQRKGEKKSKRSMEEEEEQEKNVVLDREIEGQARMMMAMVMEERPATDTRGSVKTVRTESLL